MRKLSQGSLCALLTMVILSLTGCAYDGSNFQYQSGGLPFLGMSFAVGNDADTKAEIRHADARGGVYAPTPGSVGVVANPGCDPALSRADGVECA